ncbi:hypothetical protein, partial [Serratia sp. Ag1]
MSDVASIPAITEIVGGLRYGFAQGTTRPEAWRRLQLEGLRRMLVERGTDFEAALLADLGKPAIESQLA